MMTASSVPDLVDMLLMCLQEHFNDSAVVETVVAFFNALLGCKTFKQRTVSQLTLQVQSL